MKTLCTACFQLSLDFGLRDIVLHAGFSDSGQSEEHLYGDLQHSLESGKILIF